MLSREISTLECVHHPNILRLFEVFETIDRVYLITEWIRGGELYNHIVQSGPLRETHVAPLFKQLLQATDHMHNLGFVHRDIKAENVLLLSEDRLKLADFGFSTKLIEGAQQKLDTFCGSPPYAAPELFCDDHYVGAPVDVWALGILLYFMVVGNMPFRAPTIPGLKLAILKGAYLLPSQLSLPCQRLIQCTLVHVPAHRPSINEMINSQFVAYPKLSAELMQEEINVYEHKQTHKSTRFCMKTKLKPRRKDYSIRERYEEISSKQNIPMSTKQVGTVLHNDSFLHPINSNKLLKNNQQPLRNPKRSTIFCGSLRKKVSPMIIEKESSNNKKDNIWHGNLTKEYPFFQNYDEERGDYIMMPTNTDDLSQLTSLEFETRQILADLGINSEMLRSAISKGPRSDIIGTYRIIINRLQKKSWLARKHVEMALQKMPPQQKAKIIERSCWIL